MLYESPKNLLEKRIDEVLGRCEEDIVSDLIRLSLLRTAEKDQSMLIYTEIFNLLGVDKFSSLLSLIDGQTLTFPKKEDFRESVILALCYYYRTIEKKDWTEIKDILGTPDLNTVKLGIHISQLDDYLNQAIQRSTNNGNQQK